MATQLDLTDKKVTGLAASASVLVSDPVVRIAILILSGIAIVTALDVGQVVFAPVCLSIVVGSIFGPAADRFAVLGVPSWVSAVVMVLLFILLILTAGVAFVVPLSDWLDKLPLIWSQLQTQLISWQGFFSSVSDLQKELRGVMGDNGGMQVSVDDNSAVESVFYFAPAFMAQVILFLASLYFYILTRPRLRHPAIRVSPDDEREKFLSMAFRMIEERLSAYLFSITLINLCLGFAVALAMWLLGVPSPLCGACSPAC